MHGLSELMCQSSGFWAFQFLTGNSRRRRLVAAEGQTEEALTLKWANFEQRVIGCQRSVASTGSHGSFHK